MGWLVARTVYLNGKRVCSRVVGAAKRVAVRLLVRVAVKDGGAVVIYAVVMSPIGILLTVPSRRRSRRLVVLA